MTDAELIDRLRKRATRYTRYADMLEAFQDVSRAEAFLTSARERAAAAGKSGAWIPESVTELVDDLRRSATIQLGYVKDDSSPYTDDPM